MFSRRPALGLGAVRAVSKNRYRATASERRLHGGSTVTEFYVYRDEDRDNHAAWKVVTGYGKTPGERKTDAIRRSGLSGLRGFGLGAAPSGKGVTKGRWNREMHEDFVVKAIRQLEDRPLIMGIGKHHPGAGKCDRRVIKGIVEANRLIAQARTHLASIGPREGKRTKKLWAQVGKIDKKIAKANDWLAACGGED
jgi:hypothetical protein